jgi:hypothetical protein
VVNQKNTTPKEQPETYNLQIQANKQTKYTSIKKLVPKTVAGPVHLSEELASDAEAVRRKFHDSIKI